MTAARAQTAAAALVPPAGALLILLCLRLAQAGHDPFALDPDEGGDICKALLVARGHPLYAAVWSDQPPLFTHLLRAWCDQVGWTMPAARLLVSLIAAVLVFAVADMARLAGGALAAAGAVAALAASATLPRLGVAVMIGLPSVALATLALWTLFRWRCRPHPAWLVVSGGLMAASLATKLFTALLLPLFAVWLVLVSSATAPGTRWRPLALWLGATAMATAALIALLVGPHLGALLTPHLAARAAPELARFGPGGLVLTALADWPVTGLGLAACAALAWTRRDATLIFPTWVGVAVLALLAQRPLWYHHYLLLTVPFAAAIGIALGDGARRGGWRHGMAVALLAALAAGGASRLAAIDGAADGTADGARSAMVDAMRRHAGAQHVALATDPMFAFRAGATMPPTLAILSTKRVATDPELTGAIAAVFATAPPEQVVLHDGAAPRLRAAITRGMGGNYREVFAGGGARLWVRRDLLADGLHGAASR